MDLATLRSRHPSLTYQKSAWELVGADLTFSSQWLLAPDITFNSSLKIKNITAAQVAATSPLVLDQYAFYLGLAELPSYWKAACPAQVIIAAGQLSSAEIRWWQQLLRFGLGEFYFVNQISEFAQADFVTMTVSGGEGQDDHEQIAAAPNRPAKILVPIGGGKDSIVTLALLREYQDQLGKEHPADLGIFLLNPTHAAQDIAQAGGLPIIMAERVIDPQLIALNNQGYLNGHTPFSAYLAFATQTAAHLFGYDSVAVSNERSANEGSVQFHGLEINHQWSKSFQFEQAFQQYPWPADANFSKPYYFSFLRPLYELQIGRLFAQITQAPPFDSLITQFRSCNRGSKTNTWCLACPKCLFAYILLYPFLDFPTMIKIFSRDLLADDSLYPIARDLIGRGVTKPLECVGMYEESLAAFYLATEKLRERDQELPSLLSRIQSEFLVTEPDLGLRAERLLRGWNQAHSLPQALAEFLERRLQMIGDQDISP